MYKYFSLTVIDCFIPTVVKVSKRLVIEDLPHIEGHHNPVGEMGGERGTFFASRFMLLTRVLRAYSPVR